MQLSLIYPWWYFPTSLHSNLVPVQYREYEMAPDMAIEVGNTFFTGDGIKLAWSQRLILMLSFLFYLEICDAKRWSKRRAERKASLWSRSLRISLSCWLSTWQLSEMPFSFGQSHPRKYLIHPIIWLEEQLKYPPIRNDGLKLAWKWGSQRSWPEAFFFRLSALRANKKRSGSRHKISQERIKESLWNQGSIKYLW